MNKSAEKEYRHREKKSDVENRARKIEAYWRDRGHDVRFEVFNDGTAQDPIWSIRSTLKNGLPQKLKVAA